MISNRPEKGPDLFGAMVSAAADRASSHFVGTIRFAKCDAVHLNEGFSAPDVDLETWSVSEDHQAIVVSVFATAPQDGGRTMAASGRFTFTTLTHKREYAA
ncbi:hypothetical protein [Novosphingobium sp. P6W]|uniref:hypothetical protein n=1 Tax=Novosphingobium sp. P6W TaxID=1609758 RepID=UPI0005C2CEE0|nr:hypothetical protein [Novosphingobium sp. P6W]AXB80213.1 hypothetical protein TQ38_026860 [Novosphingobium sp. P6W]KIS31564.1 hypothetical protein TQ38_15630 [Novosphingobium sp. P6W]